MEMVVERQEEGGLWCLKGKKLLHVAFTGDTGVNPEQRQGSSSLHGEVFCDEAWFSAKPCVVTREEKTEVGPRCAPVHLLGSALSVKTVGRICTVG